MAMRAAHYAETEQRLMNDAIVQQMAHDVRRSGDPKEQFAHENGTPRHGFMAVCNDRYRELGGTERAHLGAIARAVLTLTYEDEDEDEDEDEED